MFIYEKNRSKMAGKKRKMKREKKRKREKEIIMWLKIPDSCPHS